MQVELLEQLSATDAKIILERLPEKIKAALIARAAEIDYIVEAIIEMAFT